jgi:hypothetical protein
MESGYCLLYIGFVPSDMISYVDSQVLAGTQGFAFSSDGSICFNNQKSFFLENIQETEKWLTLGVCIDFLKGSISLVINGNMQSVAFGLGSIVYNIQLQTEQRYMRSYFSILIKSQSWVPLFSMAKGSNKEGKCQMFLNFGSLDFSCTVQAESCDAFLSFKRPINHIL